MCGRKRDKDGCGFTLIELLVVIAIIALLMAILMPTLQRVKRQAQTVACQSNLKQWGILFAVYRTEHDGQIMRFPIPVRDWWGGSGDPSYFARREALYLCPTARRYDASAFTVNSGSYGFGGKDMAWWKYSYEDKKPWVHGFFRSSYGFNGFLIDASDDVGIYPDIDRLRHWTPGTLKKSWNIPFLLDCVFYITEPLEVGQPPAIEGDISWGSATPPSVLPNSMIKRACIDRHGGGTINMVFTDSAVRRVGLKELWTLQWHSSFNTRGPWTKAGGVEPQDWPQWMQKFKDY